MFDGFVVLQEVGFRTEFVAVGCANLWRNIFVVLTVGIGRKSVQWFGVAVCAFAVACGKVRGVGVNDNF